MQYVTADARSDTDDEPALLDSRVRIPSHVVYRDFVNETVMLNLATGTYHGLNRTAGLMLGALDSTDTVRDAAARVSVEHGWDLETVERDMVTLCQTLVNTGLIEVGAKSREDGRAG